MKKLIRKIKWMLAGTNNRSGAVYALSLGLGMDKSTAASLAEQFTK